MKEMEEETAGVLICKICYLAYKSNTIHRQVDCHKYKRAENLSAQISPAGKAQLTRRLVQDAYTETNKETLLSAPKRASGEKQFIITTPAEQGMINDLL